MAVTSTTRKAGPFLGNDVTVVFPFAFKVFQASDLFVTTIQAGAEDENVLVLNSDYTASLNSNQDSNPGGTVTLTAGPLASGYRMVITSAVAELQEVVLTNLGGFYPDVINGALDRLTILVQQLQVQVNQALSFPITDESAVFVLPPEEQRIGKVLYFGADGSPSVIESSAVIPSGAAFFKGILQGTQDGTNKIFTLTNLGSPLTSSPLQVIVWRNFPLIPGDPNGFTPGPGANQITFATAPTEDDSLFAMGAMSV